MYTVTQTAKFVLWLDGLKDRTARARLLKRLRRVSLGNLGDVKCVGKEVWEMREHFSPGWRMYFTLRGSEAIVLLNGGEKSTQETDIAIACQLATEV